jgi:hypothetical protein
MTRKASLLAEAEAVLDKSCVSHNYFWFYREAIDAALEVNDWSEANRYCDALERYASAEPLPWSDLFVARGRALVRFGQGDNGPNLAAELNRIASVAKQAEFTIHLPPIMAALEAI